jgi:hypothetical protein
MKKYIGGFLVIAGFASFACSEAATNKELTANAPPAKTASANRQQAQVPYPEVERMPLDKAKAMYDAGTAVFVDTHTKASFETEHITGAINIPVNDYEALIDKLPKDKTIIAYCS